MRLWHMYVTANMRWHYHQDFMMQVTNHTKNGSDNELMHESLYAYIQVWVQIHVYIHTYMIVPSCRVSLWLLLIIPENEYMHKCYWNMHMSKFLFLYEQKGFMLFGQHFWYMISCVYDTRCTLVESLFIHLASCAYGPPLSMHLHRHVYIHACPYSL